MPSFLSKVFGRKKDSPDKETHSHVENRASTPLDGKFEPVSPSATKFPEAINGKSESKDKDPSPLSLFKPKSRHQQPAHAQKRVHAPHLSLNFPTIGNDANSPSLGVVFEVDPETVVPLADSVISQRQLNPAQALSLIQTCSKAIAERGLETLGVMHPFWHSASPEAQKKLLTLFIHSLATSTSPSSPSPSAYASAFQEGVSSSRSPHDVAAVLRWGLRHLQLDNRQFGKEDKWFLNFSTKERTDDYPVDAFSTILPTQLPSAHMELLKTVLELVSYLGAHSEAIGSSGSRISKFLGLWLLEAEQARNDDDWDAFYARWDHAGRILEHLFLARIRDEGASVRLPTRLAELISKYPYGGSSPETGLIPRPRFSSYQHQALFVRVETEFTSSKAPKHHPIRLLSDAFKCETTADGKYIEIWESIKKTGSDESEPSPGGYAGLGRVFAEDTIRLLSHVPSNTTNLENPFVRAASPSARKRSFSVGDNVEPTSPVPFRSKSPAPASPTAPSKIQDWGDFISSGFASEESEDKNTSLAATLIKADLEPSRHLSKARNGHARKSYDGGRGLPSMAEEPVDEASLVSKSTSVHTVQLDEAFIDFWTDALLDSAVVANWPGFVICKLKPTLSGLEIDGKRIGWLVIERQYKRPPPVSVESEQPSSESAAHLRRRSSSPRSLKTDGITSSFKRLSFLGGSFSGKSSKASSSAKKAGLRTGELGEALAEEDEEGENKLAPPAEKSRSRTSLVIPKIKVPAPKSKTSIDTMPKAVEKPAEKAESATAVAVAAATSVVGAAAVAGTIIAAAAGDAPAAEPAVAEPAAESEAKVAEEAAPEEKVAEVSEPAPAPKEAEAQATNGHSVPVPDEVKPAPVEEFTPPVVEEAPAPIAEPTAPIAEPTPEPAIPEETPAPATAEVEGPKQEEEVPPAPAVQEPIAAAAEPEETKEDVPPEVAQVLESSPHSEPLVVPDYTAGDNQVDLPAVPVVDAVPEYPMEEPTDAIPVPAPITPEPTPAEAGDAEPVDTVIAHGDTPGPQALLDHVVEEAEVKPEVQAVVEESEVKPEVAASEPEVKVDEPVPAEGSNETEEAKPAEP